MEDNQLVLAFRQLIKLIIDADKDLTELINSKSSSWDSSVEELISKITAEEQYRSAADEELEEICKQKLEELIKMYEEE